MGDLETAQERNYFECVFIPHVSSLRNTHLLSVQRSLDRDLSTARVNRKLLQSISAHDGVSQQVVDRTVRIRGRHLEVQQRRKEQERSNILFHVKRLFRLLLRGARGRATQHEDSNNIQQRTTMAGDKEKSEVIVGYRTAPLPLVKDTRAGRVAHSGAERSRRVHPHNRNRSGYSRPSCADCCNLTSLTPQVCFNLFQPFVSLKTKLPSCSLHHFSSK